MNRTPLAVLVATAALAFLAVPAARAANPPTVHVPVADLDLTKPAGQSTLAARVRHAIDQVCGSADVLNLRALQARASCAAAAEASVRAQLAAGAPAQVARLVR